MCTGTMQLVNPLPQQYLTQGKGIGGVIKSQPGDFVVERENFRLYVPLGTSLVVSIVLSVIVRSFNR